VDRVGPYRIEAEIARGGLRDSVLERLGR